MAPLAAVLVLALVVAAARLAFTGTVRFAPDPARVAGLGSGKAGPLRPDAAPAAGQGGQAHDAVLVVAGFGSNCCHAADGLRAATPGRLVRQFSYLGLNAAGQPVPHPLADGTQIFTRPDERRSLSGKGDIAALNRP